MFGLIFRAIDLVVGGIVVAYSTRVVAVVYKRNVEAAAKNSTRWAASKPGWKTWLAGVAWGAFALGMTVLSGSLIVFSILVALAVAVYVIVSALRQVHVEMTLPTAA